MESQSHSHNYESPSIADEIEAAARQMMSRGDLLTWNYEPNDNLVTLYIPNDKDLTEYPESMFGVPTALVSLPRPVPFAANLRVNERLREAVDQVDAGELRPRSDSSR